MKIEKVETIDGVVSGQHDVVFTVSEQEARAFKAALLVVEAYKKAALRAIKEKGNADPQESDWHSFSFIVENDKAIVTIKDGMAG